MTKPVVLAEMRAEGKSVRDYAEISKQIRDEVSKRGYCAGRLDIIPGYGVLSAPILDLNDDVPYALTLMGPVEQLDFEANGKHIPLLLENARPVSMQLGAGAKRWSAEAAE